MSSASFLSVASLQYIDVSLPPPSLSPPQAASDQAPFASSIPEHEVLSRIALARAEERSAVERELGQHFAARESNLRAEISAALERFAVERSTYFGKVESEIVQLSLAIARKILDREAQIDPMLLAGLVRIALDGMQGEPAVRLRVAPNRVSAWQAHNPSFGGRPHTEIVADPALSADECILETELGSAHLSFDRQLKEIEQGFLDLLGQRPDRA